ncbi:hypothetical protein PpSQ1_20180 [Pseudomonas putida]|nr:hypothetical protein PpSQ1_20180 [Pseudomonas putida]
MIDNLDFKVKLFLLASPFCLSLIGLAVDLRIACSSEYKVMKSALLRSDCLRFATSMWGEQRISSRILIIAMISSELKSPTSRIRRGSLDARDYQRFPKRLRRKIIFASRINIIGVIWLTFNYFFL